MSDYDCTIQEIAAKICAEIVEKQDDLIRKTVRTIGGVDYHHITIDRAQTLEALQLYENRFEQLPSVRPDILKAAVAKYGQSAQVDMAIEEMSELTKALCKERRTQLIQGKHAEAVSNIVEEIADVAIMLWQLMLMFDCDGEVQRQVDFKTTRLAQRLAAGGGKTTVVYCVDIRAKSTGNTVKTIMETDDHDCAYRMVDEYNKHYGRGGEFTKQYPHKQFYVDVYQKEVLE